MTYPPSWGQPEPGQPASPYGQPGFGAQPPGCGAPQPAPQPPPQPAPQPQPQPAPQPQPQPYGQPGWGVPYAPPPKPSSGKGPLIGLLVGALVLLIVVAVVVFFVVSRNPDPPVADPSPSASASPSEESPSPKTSSTADPISYKDFDDDWSSGSMSATYVDGWDYEDCGEFEEDEALTDLGCEYGVEVTYLGPNSEMKLTQLIMVMSDDDAAEEAVDDKAFDFDDFKLQKESYIPNFMYGKWLATNVGPYIVVTICTTTRNVKVATSSEYLSASNDDFVDDLESR